MKYPIRAACVALVLCGCAGGPLPIVETRPFEEPRPLERNAIERRATLSRAMSGNRVLRYGDAWAILAEGAEVEPGLIRLFYSRRVIPAANRASGDDQAEPDFWNREHVWPQSFGLQGNPARTDVHNLVPVDRTVNSSRGSKVFDEAGTPHHECTGCRVSGQAWQPPPEVQGDVARIAFYMDVRYEGDGSDVPDLALSDTPSSAATRFGKLSTLVGWHCADPVSAEERRRHEVAARAQGNRNAFVDDPALAGEVFGFSCERPVAAGSRDAELARLHRQRPTSSPSGLLIPATPARW